MSYFFEKIIIIFKKFFSGHFITKKNPTSKWTFFSKKNYNLILNVFLHLCNYYILCHIFLKKLKSFLKKFSGHFITKKNPTSKWTFFSKKNYNLILNVFLHLCNYYILCHIFLKKLKSFLKKIFFGPFYNQKKSDLKMDIFFEKKLQFDFKCVFTSV